MDWTVAGALGGVAILAGVVGYGSFALIHSDGNPPERDSKTVALSPARNRPPSAPASTAVSSQALLSRSDSSMASPSPFVVTDEPSYATPVPPPAPRTFAGNPPETPDGSFTGHSSASPHADIQPRPAARRYPADSLLVRPNAYDSAPQLYEDAPRINRPQAQQYPVQQNASSAGPARDLAGFVKHWETFRPHPFQDVGGVNIGYGTRAHPGETSISEQEAARRMDAELARDRTKIEQLNPRLPEGAKKALTSLLYNLGGDVNKLKEHGMAKAIADGDVEAMKKAHVEFSHIHGPQGTVVPGLRDRRIDELGFYNEGEEHAHRQRGINRSPPDVAVEGQVDKP